MTTAQPSPTHLVLSVETGPCAGIRAEIRTRQATIGRDADCDLVLADDATVSRRHALLQWESGGWVLRDLGSKNATRLLPGGVMAGGEGLPVAPGQSFLVGSATIKVSTAVSPAAETLEQVRILRDGDELVFELMDRRAVATHARFPWRADVAAACRKAIQSCVTASAAGARQNQDRDAGRLFHDLSRLLLPETLREALAASQAPLSLLLDPALLDYPWEMLPAGEKALGLLRPISRMVLLRGSVRAAARRGRRMLLIANPTGDLPALHEAAEDMLHTLTQHYGLWQTRFLAGPRATRAQVLSALENTDALVYLGHATPRATDADSGGWHLADGTLASGHFAALQSVPAWVLACACASARTGGGAQELQFAEGGGEVAEALLLAGVEHFFGTLWPVSAVSGAGFAAVLLGALLEGRPAGAAMLHARQALLREAAQGLLDGAAYVHYGRPEGQFPGASE